MAHIGVSKGYLIRAGLGFYCFDKTTVTFEASIDDTYTSCLVT
jgi:hypothetical protein